MATYTYDEATNREDLTDVVVNLSPTDTPIVSMIGKTKAKATYHEFPEDELAPAAENAAVEGAEFDPAEAAGRQRKGNYTQILTKAYKVTASQMAVDTAGVSDEFAYQKFKAMKEIAKDLEYAVTKNGAAVAGDKTTARKMAGLPGIIQTNVVTGASVTADVITDVLQKVWESGGTAKKLVVSGNNKKAISKMTTSNTKNISAKDKTLVEAIDVFDTDFGRVEVVASRFLDDKTIFALDPAAIKLAWLRPFKAEDLPKSSDGKAGSIVGEVTLEVRGEKGQGMINISKG